VAKGVEGASLMALHTTLSGAGAVPRFVGARLGRVATAEGDPIDVEITMEAAPSVLFDAMVLPDGVDAIAALAADGHTLEFLKDQYRHCKPILIIGDSATLLDKAGIPATLPTGDADPGLLLTDVATIAKGTAAFMAAIGKHRAFDRQMDPPAV